MIVKRINDSKENSKSLFLIGHKDYLQSWNAMTLQSWGGHDDLVLILLSIFNYMLFTFSFVLLFLIAPCTIVLWPYEKIFLKGGL